MNRLDPTTRRRAVRVTVAALGTLLILAALLGWWLSQAPRAPLSKADQSATSEAYEFATAQVNREATRVHAATEATGYAVATSTQVQLEMESLATQTAQQVAAQQTVTAEAPPTLTARASQFNTAVAQANATAGVLSAQATAVYGPQAGTLAQDGNSGGQLVCFAAKPQVNNFIAQATFSNPKVPAGAKWDYALVFAHEGEESQYRFIVDSTGLWSLDLHAPGYDVSDQDTSRVVNLQSGGSNSLKLIVAGGDTQLYINDQYVDSPMLEMFQQDLPVDEPYSLSVCKDLRGDEPAGGADVRFEGFKVWSLP